MERVFDLPIHRNHRWIFNCFTVEGASGPVLVDPGLPSVADDAITGLARLGHDIDSITALVCTHTHSDHVGGIPNILDAAPVPVYLPGRCESYLDGEQPRVFGLMHNVRFLPVLAEERFHLPTLRELARAGRTIGFGGPRHLTLPFDPSGFLSQDTEPEGLTGWETIEAPGHTDDSICFYHRDTATLLSGDAVVTLDGRAWFNPEWVDPELSAESEEMLRSLEVRHLLPGHGQPLEGADIWPRALSFTDRPEGKGLLARCSRRLGRWGR